MGVARLCFIRIAFVRFGVFSPTLSLFFRHIMTFANRLPSRKFAFFRNTGGRGTGAGSKPS